MALINSIISLFSSKRLTQIDYFKQSPVNVQRDVLQHLLTTAAETEYGKKYDFKSIWTREQYRDRLPVIQYNELAPYSERLMAGEQNLLCQNPSRGLPNHPVQPQPKVNSFP